MRLQLLLFYLCCLSLRSIYYVTSQSIADERLAPSLNSTANISIFDTGMEQDPLHKAILFDMMPSSSSLCQHNYRNSTNTGTFHYDYNFVSTANTSSWDPMAIPFEEQVFLAHFGHNDSDKNKTWSMRVGHSGFVYSFVGPAGETIPVQYHEDAPWIDEVMQCVAVDLNNNDVAGGKSWYIHQAGAYQNVEFLKQKVFYSPDVAHSCDDEKGECIFAGWGQQAHVPTNFTSYLTYFTRYKDCGNGVVEVTYLFHNIARSDEKDKVLNYLNAPWGGVRPSVYSDVTTGNLDGGGSTIVDPLEYFGSETIPYLDKTGGYITFVEDLKLADDTYDMPCGDSGDEITCPENDLSSYQVKLILKQDNGCSYSSGHHSSWGYYTIRCTLQDTANPGSLGEKSLPLTLTNQDGVSINLIGVLHWAWNGNLFFFWPEEGVEVSDFNSLFKGGDTLTVTHWDTGKPDEDNLSLTHVHGQSSTSRRRNGLAGNNQRDFNVYVINPILTIEPNSGYYNRNYWIHGRYVDSDKNGALWNKEAEEGLITLENDSRPAHPIILFSVQNNTSNKTAADSYYDTTIINNGSTSSYTNFTYFSALVVSNYSENTFLSNMLKKGSSRLNDFTSNITFCQNYVNLTQYDNITVHCIGFTTPSQINYTLPIFSISCGNDTYVGPDLYHFAPNGQNPSQDGLRPYVCKNHPSPDIRPEFQLLGYFEKSACQSIMTGYKYTSESSYCTKITPRTNFEKGNFFTNKTSSTNSSNTEAPTISPTPSPTTEVKQKLMKVGVQQKLSNMDKNYWLSKPLLSLAYRSSVATTLSIELSQVSNLTVKDDLSSSANTRNDKRNALKQMRSLQTTTSIKGILLLYNISQDLSIYYKSQVDDDDFSNATSIAAAVEAFTEHLALSLTKTNSTTSNSTSSLLWSKFESTLQDLVSNRNESDPALTYILEKIQNVTLESSIETTFRGIEEVGSEDDDDDIDDDDNLIDTDDEDDDSAYGIFRTLRKYIFIILVSVGIIFCFSFVYLFYTCICTCRQTRKVNRKSRKHRIHLTPPEDKTSNFSYQ